MRDTVEQHIRDSPARGAITYHGYVDSVSLAMNSLDALIVPSLLDGRPNVIMQANACGIPVIANPVGGIPSMIIEGLNGFLASPEDIESVVHYIDSWIKRPQSLLQMKHLSRETAEKNFSRSLMFDRYEQSFTLCQAS